MSTNKAERSADLGELVLQIARRIRGKSRQWPLAPHQARALRIIGSGDLRPARLAEVLHVTPRAVTDVVDSLAEHGFITIQPDPVDRRAKILSVTPAGVSCLEDMKERRHQASDELFASLTSDERAEMWRLLAKVVDSSD